MLTVIHADEEGSPKGRDPIHWKLITNRDPGDLIHQKAIRGLVDKK